MPRVWEEAVFTLFGILRVFVGIVAEVRFRHLDEIGLDFAVAATFIALVFPLIRNMACSGMLCARIVLSCLVSQQC